MRFKTQIDTETLSRIKEFEAYQFSSSTSCPIWVVWETGVPKFKENIYSVAHRGNKMRIQVHEYMGYHDNDSIHSFHNPKKDVTLICD